LLQLLVRVDVIAAAVVTARAATQRAAGVMAIRTITFMHLLNSRDDTTCALILPNDSGESITTCTADATTSASQALPATNCYKTKRNKKGDSTQKKQTNEAAPNCDAAPLHPERISLIAVWTAAAAAEVGARRQRSCLVEGLSSSTYSISTCTECETSAAEKWFKTQPEH